MRLYCSVGVDFNLTPEQEAFREEIRGFLRSELAVEPGRVREDGWVVGFSRTFSEKLGTPVKKSISWRTSRKPTTSAPRMPNSASISR